MKCRVKKKRKKHATFHNPFPHGAIRRSYLLSAKCTRNTKKDKNKKRTDRMTRVKD